ncbi:MAG: alpha/beta fold hydrolase [Bdellovibrionales bacterium]|nr:alpha/beta fold hydrolase [Bdellovibrionales bacterium]
MPLTLDSSYTPCRTLRSAHLQTILPTLCRRVRHDYWRRERIGTPDGDFLDLDWSGPVRSKIALLCHGLEGSSRSVYILGMARALSKAGWSVAALNFRGCSGSPNTKIYSYHSGKSEDLDVIVRHLSGSYHDAVIALVGFSLGGNVILKYLGEQSAALGSNVVSAVVFSVPIYLAGAATKLARLENFLYMQRFLILLRKKILEKERAFPGRISTQGYASIKNFRQYDDRYIAPYNGFDSAEDYWHKCSSLAFIPGITIPTLLVNSQDDPFLSPECYPNEIARRSANFHCETPAFGGHVGFVEFNTEGLYWSERRTIAFLEDVLGS